MVKINLCSIIFRLICVVWDLYGLHIECGRINFWVIFKLMWINLYYFFLKKIAFSKIFIFEGFRLWESGVCLVPEKITRQTPSTERTVESAVTHRRHSLALRLDSTTLLRRPELDWTFTPFRHRQSPNLCHCLHFTIEPGKLFLWSTRLRPILGQTQYT